MIQERREAYTEVLEVLKHMDKKYILKIPKELREFFERNASKEYEFHINSKIPFEELELKEITINLLAMLNINYWCEDEVHKKELIKKYYQNDLKREEELNFKYNTENLFKRERKIIPRVEEEYVENMPIQQDEDKWYHKIYNKILEFIDKIFKFNK